MSRIPEKTDGRRPEDLSGRTAVPLVGTAAVGTDPDDYSRRQCGVARCHRPRRHGDPADGRRAREEFLDVWTVRVPRRGDLSGALDRTALSPQELKRRASFRRSGDALRYHAAHITLRHVLALYLDLAPGALDFVRTRCPKCDGPHGRPQLALPGPGLHPPVHFSLSHSGDLVVVAVASAPVGADVQRIPGAETARVCARALHPAERAELDRLPANRRRAAFAWIWTRKEAYLKGIGTGLCRPPHRDYLGAAPSGRPCGWTLFDIACIPGYAAAAAVRGQRSAPPDVRELPLDTVLRSG